MEDLVVSDIGREEEGGSKEGARWSSSFRMMRRAVGHYFRFLPSVMLIPLAFWMPRFRRSFWYVMLVNALARSGAAFIKWGQWASTRPDMFPEALCKALSVLHASAPQHSFHHTKKIIRETMGEPIYEVFDEFEEKAIASGSIAQIHRARILNMDIAVKVRHPNVEEEIETDFRLMKKLARALKRLNVLGWLDLEESMKQFSHTMTAQTDLAVEGIHLDLFNHNFKNWRDIRFPRPLYGSKALLVETFEKGTLISEVIPQYSRSLQKAAWKPRAKTIEFLSMPLRYLKSLRRKTKVKVVNQNSVLAHYIVSRGEDVYLKMLLADNLMHADLHPGNIMLDDDDPMSPRLVVVDTGMVAKLTEDEQKNFIGVVLALGDGNGREAADRVLEFGEGQRLSEEEREEFRKDMEELFHRDCRGYFTGVDVGVVFRAVLGLARKHRVKIGANYATLLLNVLCLDGLAKALEPGYNLLDAARPLLLKYRLTRGFLGRILYKLFFPVFFVLKTRRDRALFKADMKSMGSENYIYFSVPG